MIIETEFGNFTLIDQTKDAFDMVKFLERYVPDTFDKYDYIVGDMASDLLRIKGFYENPKEKKNIKTIPDYLNETCNFNCGYFILKRIK